MKTVFSDISTIAHMWANQTQDNARNSGNFFFDGDVIYSYGRHFAIARHVSNAEGEKAVLFTTRKYSVTTSKHIGVVRQAVNHKDIIYCSMPSPNAHSENFAQWITNIENVASNLLKAKKPEKYLIEIDQIRQQVLKYCNFFSLNIPSALQTALNVSNKQEYAQYTASKAEFERIEKEKAQKELKKQHAKQLKDWLSGKSHRLYIRDGFDYLRVKGNRIETTQAVQIPFKLGKTIYNKIVSNSLQVGDKILDYTIDEVGSEIKVGCHTFKASYLLQFGKRVFDVKHTNHEQ